MKRPTDQQIVIAVRDVARSRRSPVPTASGWLLLAVALWLFGAAAIAQTQTQRPTQPAMPAHFLDNPVPHRGSQP